MNKLIFSTAIMLTLSGCVVGPPPDNERDRRAYGSLQEVQHDQRGYYDRDGVWHEGGYYDSQGNYHASDNDYTDGYNPHTGQDEWAKHDSK